MTLTLLWNAQVDLDLTFLCDDGVLISDDETSNTCGGTKQVSSTGSTNDLKVERGSFLGKIETISLTSLTEGSTYSGQVILQSTEQTDLI